MTEPPFDTGGPSTPPGFAPATPWGAAAPLAAARDATRRRFLLVMAAFGVLLAVSAVGFVLTAGGDVRDSVVSARDGLGRQFSARPAVPEETATRTGPVPKPVVYRGTGSKRLRIRRPEPGDAVVYVRGRNANGLFTVTGYDANGVQTGFAVAETGSYAGVRVLDLTSVLRTTTLEIDATGRWVVEVRSARSARAFTGTASGTGDAVLRYDGPPGTATIRGGRAMSAFRVTAYDDGVPYPVVISVGAFAGRKPWPAGPVLVEVRAAGRWSIRV